MSLLSRIYLNWDEASELLDVDREGLRQLMADKLSPYLGDRESPWLPVIINSKGDDFFTHLMWDHETRRPNIHWKQLHFNIQDTVIEFPDGSELPLKGKEDGASWEAASQYRHGYDNCFLLGGEKLAVCPETVRRACEEDGHIKDLSIAPYAWCENGFSSDLYFRVLESTNSLHVQKPENIFNSTFFLPKDILRIRPVVDRIFGALGENNLSQEANRAADDKPRDETMSNVKEKPIDLRERANLLRVIRALSVMAKLPERGATASILKQLEELGLLKPEEATIRKFIREARALEPD
jgi:hypothetical protein